jgi:hypothetical protein
MLTVKQCRQHLPPELRSMPDEEVERLRDALAALASVALESLQESGSPETFRPVHGSGELSQKLVKQKYRDLTTAVAEYERELILERAAIMEFDGGLEREAAEDLALSDWGRITGRLTKIQ